MGTVGDHWEEVCSKYEKHICNKIEEIEGGEHIKMKLRTSIGIYTQLEILKPHNTP